MFSSAGATVVVLQPDLQAAPARWAPRCAGPPRGRPRTALGPTRTAPGRGGRDTGPGGRHRRADLRFQAGPHLPREVPAALGRWPGAARAQPREVLAPGSQRRRGWSWPGWEEGLAGRASPELAPPVGPVRHGEAASLQLLDVHGQQARRGQGGRGAGPPAFHQTQAVALQEDLAAQPGGAGRQAGVSPGRPASGRLSPAGPRRRPGADPRPRLGAPRAVGPGVGSAGVSGPTPVGRPAGSLPDALPWAPGEPSRLKENEARAGQPQGPWGVSRGRRPPPPRRAVSGVGHVCPPRPHEATSALCRVGSEPGSSGLPRPVPLAQQGVPGGL